MQTIVIASGDSRRGDEGVAHRVLELLGAEPNVFVHDVPKLNAGLAEEIGRAEDVMFIDASKELGDPWVEPARGASDTAEIVDLARSNFSFRGNAYVCHVPGLDFSEGTRLTAYAEARARKAVDLVKRFLSAVAQPV
ncbi:MAG: hypothetical protein R2762_02540 [Bryobacteraceae bacterium]